MITASLLSVRLYSTCNSNVIAATPTLQFLIAAGDTCGIARLKQGSAGSAEKLCRKELWRLALKIRDFVIVIGANQPRRRRALKYCSISSGWRENH